MNDSNPTSAVSFDNFVFFLGGKDLEMETIRGMLSKYLSIS
jgi:hypothetical protein